MLLKLLTIECGSDVTNFVASTLNKEVILYYSVFQVDEEFNLMLNTTKRTPKLVYSKNLSCKLTTKTIINRDIDGLLKLNAEQTQACVVTEPISTFHLQKFEAEGGGGL